MKRSPPLSSGWARHGPWGARARGTGGAVPARHRRSRMTGGRASSAGSSNRECCWPAVDRPSSSLPPVAGAPGNEPRAAPRAEDPDDLLLAHD